ncbi:MAG: sugar phosphate isomerase/epimerase [Candidatus Heimdallarchaeota archaeon]|nr:MAG: sugar phosphate isomerase/epimerase [Candidatus Heimdallarchaeota archaeon]
MKPLICYNLSDLKEFATDKTIFDGYELSFSKESLKPNIIILMKLKKLLREKDLSLHSQLSRIFSCNEKGFSEFSEAEVNILKAEIIISKIIGIKQISFHMKETEFTKDEIEKFNEVIEFAKQNGIEMIYENHVCSEEVIFRVLETFPKVNFCLDMGHLNVAIHKGKFRINLDGFLDKVKSKLVCIHVHNNYGEKDEHNALDNGNFDWKSLLNKLKDGNLRKIIIENRAKSDILKSKKLLEDFY